MAIAGGLLLLFLLIVLLWWVSRGGYSCVALKFVQIVYSTTALKCHLPVVIGICVFYYNSIAIRLNKETRFHVFF